MGGTLSHHPMAFSIVNTKSISGFVGTIFMETTMKHLRFWIYIYSSHGLYVPLWNHLW